MNILDISQVFKEIKLSHFQRELSKMWVVFAVTKPTF